MAEVGPPRGAEQPNCGECGSWMYWDDMYDEIKGKLDSGELSPEEAPPGSWGTWRCPSCFDTTGESHE